MLSKEQYESLQPYRQVLELFKKTGTCVGGIDELYSIYEGITGQNIKRGCGSCKGRMLLELNIMINLYDKANE